MAWMTRLEVYLRDWRMLSSLRFAITKRIVLMTDGGEGVDVSWGVCLSHLFVCAGGVDGGEVGGGGGTYRRRLLRGLLRRRWRRLRRWISGRSPCRRLRRLRRCRRRSRWSLRFRLRRWRRSLLLQWRMLSRLRGERLRGRRLNGLMIMAWDLVWRSRSRLCISRLWTGLGGSMFRPLWCLVRGIRGNCG